MQRLIAAGLLAAPFFAHAGTDVPPTHTKSSYILDVEYWGTVYDVSVGDGVAVGDSLHGTLHVQSRLAPRDFIPDAREASYIWNEPRNCVFDCPPPRIPAPSGFVTRGDGTTIEGVSGDHVSVVDGRASKRHWDRFGVEDFERTSNGFAELVLDVGAPLDFVKGDSLAQAFDVRAKEAGGSGYGIVHELVGGAHRLFAFAVDRLRVAPRVCHP
jgi:hypothetical protein